MYYSTTHPSDVGLLTLACDGDGKSLIGLWMEGQKYHGANRTGYMTEKNDLPLFDAAKQWIDQYFAGRRPKASALPLAPIGTAFQKSVWEILREIPYGEVTTYGDIAKKIATRAGRDTVPCRAVGGAVARNPISLIIPCHRVVGSGGNLTGFSGGIAAKIRLLTGEGVDMSRLFAPPIGGK